MMTKKERNKMLFILVSVNLIFILLSALYAHEVHAAGGEGVVSCGFKHVFKLYCPGCGGSRSLVHLFYLDIISATLAYPPMPVLLFFYVDLNMRFSLAVTSYDTHYIKSFKLNRLIIIPVFILISFVIRNVLLVCLGIDYLGDLSIYYSLYLI